MRFKLQACETSTFKAEQIRPEDEYFCEHVDCHKDAAYRTSCSHTTLEFYTCEDHIEAAEAYVKGPRAR